MMEFGGDAIDFNFNPKGNCSTIDDISAVARDVGFTGIVLYRYPDFSKNKNGRLHVDRRPVRWFVEKAGKGKYTPVSTSASLGLGV